jgi:hypothetical protein
MVVRESPTGCPRHKNTATCPYLSSRLGEKKGYRPAGRSHDDPSLRAAVVSHRRRVLDQLKAEDADEESNGVVVVIGNERQLLKEHACQRTTTTADHTGKRARKRQKNDGAGMARPPSAN